VCGAGAGGPVRRPRGVAEDGAVVVAAGATVTAFGPAGAPRWQRRLPGAIVSGPVVTADGSTLVAYARGKGSGELRILDARGGDDRTIALAALPVRSLALASGRVWVGLDDLTLPRSDVAALRLARSSAPTRRAGPG